MVLTTSILADAANAAGRHATIRQTAAELEAQLAKAREEEAAAERDAAEKARQRVAWLKQSRLKACAAVEDLESQLSALSDGRTDHGRPTPQAREAARRFLHPIGPEVDQLPRLLELDPPVAAAYGLHRECGRLMAHLGVDYGIDADDELYGRADDVEASAWGAMVHRARVIAGEE